MSHLQADLNCDGHKPRHHQPKHWVSAESVPKRPGVSKVVQPRDLGRCLVRVLIYYYAVKYMELEQIARTTEFFPVVGPIYKTNRV